MELTRRCGVLFKKLSSNEVLNQLNFINVRCCRPPLKERQVYKIFNSIRKREGV